MVGDPSGKRFRGLPKKVRPGAAEYQESGPPSRSVHKHPQDPEEPLAVLDLVNDDEPFQILESQHRIGEAGSVGRVFQVERSDRARLSRNQATGQRGLADLARAYETHDRELT